MIIVRRIEKALDKTKKPIDVSMWFFSIVGPLSSLPQVLEIFLKKEARGVSVTSWVLYLVISISAMAYAIIHREKVILASNLLWSVMYLLVIVGALMYGKM